MIRMLIKFNRSIKHKLNDEFEYKQFVTVLTYCFVFLAGFVNTVTVLSNP